MPEFAHLLSPGRIGTLELKNRLFQTAMGTNLANGDGTISEDSIGFYAARAAGGAAMLIMGTMGDRAKSWSSVVGRAAWKPRAG